MGNALQTSQEVHNSAHAENGGGIVFDPKSTLLQINDHLLFHTSFFKHTVCGILKTGSLIPNGFK